jgi:hypothetical protein
VNKSFIRRWNVNGRLFKSVAALALIVLLALTVLPSSQAPVAHAGNNGQQLFFYKYSSTSANIAYLYVSGTNQNNQPRTWSRTFSPAVSSYSLSGYWWKGNTTIRWRLSDGRTGSCIVSVPVSHAGDWKQIGVDRQPGNSCWFS